MYLSKDKCWYSNSCLQFLKRDVPMFEYQNLLLLENCGGQSSNLYLNVVNFFNTSVNKTSVAAEYSCSRALVSNVCCSIVNDNRK
jgi:hypothetical protein